MSPSKLSTSVPEASSEISLIKPRMGGRSKTVSSDVNIKSIDQKHQNNNEIVNNSQSLRKGEENDLLKRLHQVGDALGKAKQYSDQYKELASF